MHYNSMINYLKYWNFCRHNASFQADTRVTQFGRFDQISKFQQKIMPTKLISLKREGKMHIKVLFIRKKTFKNFFWSIIFPYNFLNKVQWRRKWHFLERMWKTLRRNKKWDQKNILLSQSVSLVDGIRDCITYIKNHWDITVTNGSLRSNKNLHWWSRFKQTKSSIKFLAQE